MAGKSKKSGSTAGNKQVRQDNYTVEELLKEIDKLKAQNAALVGKGKVNRQAKDAVFIGLADDPQNRLEIYRALHPEDKQTTAEDIALVTIENVLTTKPYNDVGLMLGGGRKRKLLILCEAQSRWSVNVLIRLWQYIVDSIMNYFINNGADLYASPKLDMPDVEAYIVYTGKSVPRILNKAGLPKDEYGRLILSMNTEFFNGESGKPELQARVIYAENGKGILEEYIKFSQVFDEQRLKHKDEPDKMISEVFRICEERGILRDYLKTHRSEVEKIMMTMVSPEYIEKASKQTAKIQEAIESLRDFDVSEDKIKEHLIKKFHLTPTYAQNCLDADWDDDGII